MNAPIPIRVQPGAANYFLHAGALDQIENFFPSATLKQVLWIGGARAQAAATPYLPPLYTDERSIRVTFSGHCSESQVQDLAKRGSQADLVIGLGGGSALDTAKAVAHRLQKPFIAIPTIAATCAAWTPLAVWYDDDERALGYELFPLASHLVLVEPRILLAAPPEYLRAGIGDTLAKWYEARVLCQKELSLPFTARLGLATAEQLKDILLADGPAALQAVSSGTLTEKFLGVVDAIIAGGGLVGGLGERYTRIAAAHAIHNGLTVLPETAGFLHGAKVAYGILVQLALEEKHDELQRLSEALAELGLPTKLAQLNVDFGQVDKIEALIAHCLRAVESIHLLPGKVDPLRLRQALHTVEAL
ncbi:MAG: 3-dehydroquinate synthase [Proteobacteria bacterium]|nr:3-dehydroquinate synthase [Pseudomonadota bacterium]